MHSEACGAAGEVEHAKYRYCKSGVNGPSMASKDFSQLRNAGVFCESAGGKVAHKHYRDDGFICRKSEDECSDYDAVNTEKSAERIEKSGEAVKKGNVPRMYICKYPYDSSGRGSYDKGAAEDEYSPVKYGSYDNVFYFRLSVWRQFKDE